MSGFRPPFIPGGAPPVVGCATYVAAGHLEVATFAETQAGTYLGGSGCPLAVNPVNVIFREEVATGAHFSAFSSPILFVGAFGVYAVDIQPNRTNVLNAAIGARSICVGADNRCDAGGAAGIGMGEANVVRAARGIAMGGTNHAYGNNSVSIGYRNEAGAVGGAAAECLAVGRSNFATAYTSMAVGVMNNVVGLVNLNQATGAIAGDPQTVNPYGIGINSVAVGIINTVGYTFVGGSGLRSSAMGFYNRNYGIDSHAVGGFNYVGDTVTRGHPFGYANTVSADRASAFGDSNNVVAPYSSAFGYANYVGSNYSNAIGSRNNIAAGYAYATALGDSCDVDANNVNAIGYGASGQVDDTTNLAGALIIRNDDGEVIADAVRVFSGAEIEILTPEIDLTAAAADYTITLPAGCHFYWTECGIIVSAAVAALVTQPTVRFGITGTPAKYLAAVLTTLLTAQYKRERFETLLADDGETSLLFGVTVSGAAGALLGRAYFKGVLVEDE